MHKKKGLLDVNIMSLMKRPTGSRLRLSLFKYDLPIAIEILTYHEDSPL